MQDNLLVYYRLVDQPISRPAGWMTRLVPLSRARSPSSLSLVMLSLLASACTSVPANQQVALLRLSRLTALWTRHTCSRSGAAFLPKLLLALGTTPIRA